MSSFDVIGDIHGHLAPLENLLISLGYKRHSASWHHPDRTVLFLGDFIDRGPDQLAVLKTVRAMIDSGNALAVCGNHEWNAIGWGTLGANGAPLRVHGAKNRAQHAAFLEAVGEGSEEHREWIRWFKTLPMFLDLGELRLVHACWHRGEIDVLKAVLKSDYTVPDDMLEQMFTRDSALSHASETVLKGLEAELPDGLTFFDKDGHERRRTRMRWWDQEATTFRSAALVDSGASGELPESPVPADMLMLQDAGTPIFFGHYWMVGTPFLVSAKFACLDFSVANDGVLAAYGFDGEQSLLPSKLVWAGHRGSGPPR